jgi:cysteinyl-tRNA synthetase
MEWNSPWGVGFPGWHIECSAMAMKYLGETIDVHTGGIDHIPVHHTNEIAQSETATGKQFARYWMHVAFLTVDGGKMSKSLGNFYTLQDIVDKGYDPLAFRYLLLTAKYSAGLNFTWNSLDGSQKALSSLRERITEWDNKDVVPNSEFIEEFRKLVNDDINTPRAIALAWAVANDKALSDATKRSTILEFDKVLGLRLGSMVYTEIPAEVQTLVAKRDDLRKEGKWKESDVVRIEIIAQGYEVEDTSTGPRVVKRRS